MFLAHVAGIHDANFTTGEVFLDMLRDERAHQTKATSVAYHDQGKQLNGKLDFVMPSEELCKLRNETVDQMIFGIGQKLRQSALTQHLAAKLFDLAFVHQQEFTGGLDEAISRFVRQSLVAAADENQEGNGPSKEDIENQEKNAASSQGGDVRNEPKNLKMLAGQCLLLSSKVTAVQRVYPAEIVYQVRGWNRDEFEVLRSGSIEEYLLGLLDFDLVLLTPADFLMFTMQSWD